MPQARLSDRDTSLRLMFTQMAIGMQAMRLPQKAVFHILAALDLSSRTAAQMTSKGLIPASRKHVLDIMLRPQRASCI
jgi:hypothetical protein